MLKSARQLWRHARSLLPVQAFFFDRPLVILQSDDWGRVGVRDQAGAEQLRSAGISLGTSPYDFYSLETAGDVGALADLLRKHRDSTGRSPSLVMNFILANVDFHKTAESNFRQVHWYPLTKGLPGGWERPALFKAYNHGIADGVFYPALHGLTHLCRRVVEGYIADGSERGALLRTLWQAGTPYIYWRMPWVGYEYWDPEPADSGDGFLPAALQQEAINRASEIFTQLFSLPPRSACAPGYRSNHVTHRSWAQRGVRVAQHGTSMALPPHLDESGILSLSRTVDFEPAVAPAAFSLKKCVDLAETCLTRGVPAVVSIHSINFHSTLRDFGSATLRYLDEFLTALENRHPDLLYLHDSDLWSLVQTGKYESRQGTVTVNVKQRGFRPASFRVGAA